MATAQRPNVIGLTSEKANCIHKHISLNKHADVQLGFVVLPGFVKWFFQVLEKQKNTMSQVQ